MLQTIRDRLTGWVATIVILVIGVALIITFGNMDTNVVGNTFAARVNGEEIPAIEFREVLQNQEQQLQAAYGGEIPDTLRAELADGVLESLMRQRLIKQYVKHTGYRVSDQVVADYIRAISAFQLGGEFSNVSYEALLVSEGLTPIAFEQDQRSALEVRQLQEGIINSAFYTPTEFRRFILLDGEKRKIDYVVLDADSYIDDLDVDETAIEAYYRVNQPQFETEESVDLEYIELNLAEIIDEVEVREKEVRAYFDEDPNRYRTDEERRARHILISADSDTDELQAENLAEDLRQRLVAGESFEVLAEEYSDDSGSAADGGDLGWVAPEDFVSEFSDSLFSLALGELSESVKTEFGFHIIRLEEIREGSQKTYADVRNELIVELREQKAEELFYGRAELLDDLALESLDGLAMVADEMGLELQQASAFTRGGGLPLGSSQNLISMVFSLEVLEDRENSPVVELEDGRVAVVHVTNHRLPEIRPLDEVRAGIKDILLSEQATVRAQDASAKLLSDLHGGADLATAAAESGIGLVSTGLFRRDAEDLPADLLAAVFTTPKPDAGGPVFSSAALASGGFAVYQVIEVVPGRPEDFPREQRDGRKELLARQSGQTQAAALVAELREQADVKVASDLFEDLDAF
jgi:peptidyl-prolyl cis-trans isomerase D